MDVRLGNWIVAYPQFLDPNPQVIGNVQFRKALALGLDRQQMADTFQAGLSPVGHSYVTPQDPSYRNVESSIVRYDYDPRRAIEMIESLGYRRGADGLFEDRIPVEVRVGAGDDLTEKSTLSIADDWKRIGIAAEGLVVPAQRIRDREYAATFPGFYVRQNPNDPARLGRFASSRIPLAENRFTGENNPRYANPEFDALLDRYSVTIPTQQRAQALAQIVIHLSDRVIMLGLFYTNEPTLIATRLQNVTARPPNSTQAWNAHEWSAESADG
jgi:peptide/nickel transport system substrate-binding protein